MIINIDKINEDDILVRAYKGDERLGYIAADAIKGYDDSEILFIEGDGSQYVAENIDEVYGEEGLIQKTEDMASDGCFIEVTLDDGRHGVLYHEK